MAQPDALSMLPTTSNVTSSVDPFGMMGVSHEPPRRGWFIAPAILAGPLPLSKATRARYARIAFSSLAILPIFSSFARGGKPVGGFVAPLVNPDQIVNLFSADGVHSYVERHYGHTAAKIAGTIIVFAVVLFAIAVCYYVITGGISVLKSLVSGAAWPALPTVAWRDALGVLVAVIVTVWFSRRIAANARTIDALNNVLTGFATTTKERLDAIDARGIEHHEVASNRLKALEEHTKILGADQLKELLEKRVMERLAAARLTIHSARYGIPGHENDVTQILRTMASRH